MASSLRGCRLRSTLRTIALSYNKYQSEIAFSRRYVHRLRSAWRSSRYSICHKPQWQTLTSTRGHKFNAPCLKTTSWLTVSAPVRQFVSNHTLFLPLSQWTGRWLLPACRLRFSGRSGSGTDVYDRHNSIPYLRNGNIENGRLIG